MGSFNVACTVSNLTIDCGEKCCYIPLGKCKYKEEHPAINNSMLIGADCYFSPALMPIWGTYNDYGRVAIDQDANNPKHLGLIKNLINCEDEIDPYEDSHELIVSGMYVLKSVWDKLIDKLYSDYGGNIGGYDCNEDGFRNIKSILPDPERVKEQQRLALSGENPYEKNYFISTLSECYFRDYCPLFLDTYIEYVKEFEKELYDLFKFNQSMYAVNRFFFPAMNGCQHGNHFMAKMLSDVTQQVLVDKISERLEDEDEDDEDADEIRKRFLPKAKLANAFLGESI